MERLYGSAGEEQAFANIRGIYHTRELEARLQDARARTVERMKPIVYPLVATLALLGGIAVVDALTQPAEVPEGQTYVITLGE